MDTDLVLVDGGILSRPMRLFGEMSSERRYEICGVFVLALTMLLFLALVTDGYHGDVERRLDGMSEAANILGKPGAVTAGCLTLLFGPAAHVIYCVTIIWGCMLLRHMPLDRFATRILGLVLLAFTVAALVHIDAPLLAEDGGASSRSVPQGGVLGGFVAGLVAPRLGWMGANVVVGALALVGMLLSTEFLLFRGLTRLRIYAWATLKALWVLAATALNLAATAGRGGWAVLLRGLKAFAQRHRARREFRAAAARDLARRGGKKSAKRPRVAPALPEALVEFADPGHDTGEPAWFGANLPTVDVDPETPFDDAPVDPEQAELPARVEGMASVDADAEDNGEAGPVAAVEPDPDGAGQQLELAADAEPVAPLVPIASSFSDALMPRRKTQPVDELPPDYVYPKRYAKPSFDLFDPPPKRANQDMGDRLLRTGVLLEETLKTFGIAARVTDVTRGPTITRYELEPAPGVKVSRFVSLADDIALALKAHRVRVEAPIPGKGRVGVEVPNIHREPVVVRELLESRRFSTAKGRLKLALGKDIAGEVVVTDLATMPHLLVAGATGAGKTVCVKTMIASLLSTQTPDEMQLMLIDPKMVELSIFNDVPHLVTPVVTDPKKAAGTLRWLITEMEQRYHLFTHLRVRNIEVYNRSVENGEIEMPESEGGNVDVIRKLPYIVCIIDELADLMMLARAEVEDAIARLAQLARAVGIHLVIATQRPSVDVLTGVIKANFPARISFQVSSRVDSRCILDAIGAERLIGRGDMLFLPAGQSKPARIQGAYVSDDAMTRLIAYLKTQAPPQYRDEVENFGQGGDALESMEDQDDELFDEAVRVVLETGQASISMVQRRLRVGYTRAARLIDMMEMRGIVGPHVGSKAREILVNPTPNDEVA